MKKTLDMENFKDAVIDAVQARDYRAARDLIDKLADQAELWEREFHRMKEMNEKLEESLQAVQQPPLTKGIILGHSPDNQENVLIGFGGQQLEVGLLGDENLKRENLKPGDEAWLSSERNVVKVRPSDRTGEIAEVINVLDEGRLEVKAQGHEGTVVRLAARYQGEPPEVGDRLRVNAAVGLAFEKLPPQKNRELELEKVPDITYEDIGGLDQLIGVVRDAIELPYLFSKLFKLYQLARPKGILLYGPPGCGKTMIAKAVANNLTKEINHQLDQIVAGLALLEGLDAQLGEKAGKEESTETETDAATTPEAESDENHEPSETISQLYKRWCQLRRESSRDSGPSPQFESVITNELGEPIPTLDVDWSPLQKEALKEPTTTHEVEETLEPAALIPTTDRHASLHNQEPPQDEVIPPLNTLREQVVEFLDTRDINLDNVSLQLNHFRDLIKQGSQAFFISIKGPELLNKYVGETEHSIRRLFQQAKRKASATTPVVMFFDEIEALFHKRGSRSVSGLESTVVPQFLSEIDGVEGLEHVIIIGATNRQDILDPAILRPGRLDIKIKVNRPDEHAAKAILEKYLKSSLPLSFNTDTQQEFLTNLIEKVVGMIYDSGSRLKIVGAQSQIRHQHIPVSEMASGAMIANIVNRAKKHALRRHIDHGDQGIREEDFMKALREELEENKDQIASAKLGVSEDQLSIAVEIKKDTQAQKENVWMSLPPQNWMAS